MKERRERTGPLPDTADDYEDIINLPHPVSGKHTPMPMLNRAAQFAPFAAVTGFDPEGHVPENTEG